ncbi:MAG: sensor histidine kinase, partial [Candidatus Promineifilaceae bacterium]
EAKDLCNVILLTQEAVADLQGQALSKGITLELTVDEEEKTFWVQGDETLIRQAISNLIDNAIKYSPYQSVIQMNIARKDSSVEFKIEDNGIGIAPSDLPFIFEEFYQVRGDSNKEGIGLGLTLVRSIAEAHGGQVWVKSAYDSGTAFGLQIPLVDQALLETAVNQETVANNNPVAASENGNSVQSVKSSH